MREFERTGSNWLPSFLTGSGEGSLWKLEEECRRRLLDNKSSIVHALGTASCMRGNSPFSHCLFLSLIVHPWLANLVLFDAALPLYLHISRVSGNGAGNLAVQSAENAQLEQQKLCLPFSKWRFKNC